MFGFGAGNVAIGYAIDRWGYWRPALIAAIVLAAGFGLAAIATSIVQIALIHGLLIGIGSSAIFGPLIADISHWFLRRRGIAHLLSIHGLDLPRVLPAWSGSYAGRSSLNWPLVRAYQHRSSEHPLAPPPIRRGAADISL